MAKEVQTKRILLLKKLKLSIKLQNGIKQMATKLGMFSVTHESVTVPVGRDRNALRTNQIARFVWVGESVFSGVTLQNGKTIPLNDKIKGM